MKVSMDHIKVSMEYQKVPADEKKVPMESLKVSMDYFRGRTSSRMTSTGSPPSACITFSITVSVGTFRPRSRTPT